MPTIIGIDLGTHTIKLSLMEGSFGRYQLSDVRVMSVPQDLDTAPDLDARLGALGRLLT